MRHHYPSLDDYRKPLQREPAASGGYRIKPGYAPIATQPLVSIITVTYNAEGTLRRTLESVRRQTYANIEHIVVDGGSTDGTLDIVHAADSIAYWRSEPDRGIYDAFNKGVALAHGEYIGILNADDYYQPDQIENAVAALSATGAPFVHGDITMHGWKGMDVELRGDPDYASKIRLRMPALFHVTMLCRSELFQRFGLFMTKYRIAGDYEWLLRLARHEQIGMYDPKIRAHMQAGGVSTTQQRRALWEAGLIIRQHGAPVVYTIQATAVWLMFPNGHAHIVPRVREALRSPVGTLKRIAQRISAAARDRVKLEERSPLPLLPAFLDARQTCRTITPAGLAWLYDLGSRCKSFAIEASPGREVSAATRMLSAAGARLVANARDAEILIVDIKQLADAYDWERRESSTILIVRPGTDSPGLPHQSHLDFGGLIATGFFVRALVESTEAAQ